MSDDRPLDKQLSTQTWKIVFTVITTGASLLFASGRWWQKQQDHNDLVDQKIEQHSQQLGRIEKRLDHTQR